VTVVPAHLRRRLGESAAAIREVAGQAQLRRAEVAYALSCTGEGLFTVGLGVVAFRHGGATAVGVVALARMVPAALASPLITAVADRAPRERVLAAVSGWRAGALVAAGVMLHTTGSNLAVYVLGVAAAVAFTVYRPTHSALLPLLCTTTRALTSANVVRGIIDAASALCGPALAGVLLAVSDAPAVIAGAGVLSLGALVIVRRIRYEASPVAASTPTVSVRRDTAEGLRTVVGDRDLSLIFGLGFAQSAVRGALNVFTVVLALGLLDTGDQGVAALSAAVGAGGLIGSVGVSLLVGSRHLGAWLAVALVLWGAPFTLIGLAPTELAAFVLLAVVGLGNAIIDVPLFTLPVRLASDVVLARVFGVFEALVALGVGVGSVLTPVLISLAGLRGALVGTGLLLPLLAVLCWRRLGALDARMSVHDDEIAVLRNAPMLGQLPVASIEYLASQMRRLTIPAGALLFEQGDAGNGFYAVVDGTADITGDGVLVRTVGPGETFGEIALLHDVPRTATIRARDDLTVLELDRDVFLHAVSGHRVSTDAARATVARHLANFTPAPAGI